MVEKRKAYNPITGEYEMVDHYESSDFEQMKLEKKYEENARKAAEEIRGLYMQFVDELKGKSSLSVEENTRKIDILWEIGRVIVEFNQEFGIHRSPCHRCEYKNLVYRDECYKCDAKIEKETKNQPYMSDQEIRERILQDEDIPIGKNSNYLEDAQNFYRQFPDGDYPTTLDSGEPLAWSKMREVSFLANLPRRYWQRLLDAIMAEEVTKTRGDNPDIRVLRKEIKEEFDEDVSELGD